MRFIEEAAENVQPWFPQSIGEGMLKFFILGGVILATYDLLSPQNTEEQIRHVGSRILLGYLFFVTFRCRTRRDRRKLF